MAESPDVIWTTGSETSGSWNSSSASTKRITLNEVEYVRKDKYDELKKAADELSMAVKQWADCDDDHSALSVIQNLGQSFAAYLKATGAT